MSLSGDEERKAKIGAQDDAARAARNEELFRELNERLSDINGNAVPEIGSVCEWICECANGTCIERVPMSFEKYETIRASGRHFLVAPSDEHVLHSVETVINRNDRYWVVEKNGAAGTSAARTNPRSDDPPLRLKT